MTTFFTCFRLSLEVFSEAVSVRLGYAAFSTPRLHVLPGWEILTRSPSRDMSDPFTPLPQAKSACGTLAHSGPPKRSATQRVADFLEIYGLYDEVAAQEQASRCVHCSKPMCVAGCPLEAHIPEWLSLTAEGHFGEAADLLQSTGSLPEICARICPSDHLCEGMCVVNGRTEPVSVRAVEQFLSEYAFSHGTVSTSVAPPNGWRVAIVGAGPGGLVCASELVKQGYAVTVFDSRPTPGGLLVYGTPAFKLERSIVRRRIEILKKQGVVFRLGIKVGKDVDLTELQSEFDCIYLSFGGKKARTLDVPGEGLNGVFQALPYIMQKNSDMPLDPHAIDVTGKRVVVLGGGDTAVDCVRTALRCGAREAFGIYRRDLASMPCSHSDYDNAIEEGVRYVFQALPLAILGNAKGDVTGLRLVRTALGKPDTTGRRPFSVQLGTEFEMETDCIFLALGFVPAPLPPSSPFHVLAPNEWGGVKVDAQLMTSCPGIFAGGDLVRGPGTALDSVRDARRAVIGIHSYLRDRKASGTASPA
ncbi:MAG: NAD(P)-dependent oxidoreductase [Opitutaceae bacterium]|nr:NAD(P)-dependent oxidoreductase [Opitutaceae bacterium]